MTQTLTGRKFVKGFGLSWAVLSALIALFYWLLAFYRLSLYHGIPYENHADDLPQVYHYGVIGAILGIPAVLLLWRVGRRSRRIAIAAVLANLLVMLTFFVMHRCGILVSYDEFIQHWGH